MENVQQNKDSQYTIIGFSHKDKYYIKYYDVICVCGNCKKLKSQELKKNISCGCHRNYDYLKTHKLTKTTEYKSWQSMKDRCFNKNNPSYLDYGGRGITVSDEWKKSFELFYSNMGIKPSKNHTLERVDVNGNYTKENCKWATKKEQCNNRRSNCLLTYNEITKTRSEWADFIGVNVRTLASRHKAGKTIEQILKPKPVNPFPAM
jgi:hypothetical protein